MSWRVCRILDFKKDCTSVHALEEIAKMDTARHLAALASKLHEDLPKFRGVWNYPRVFPGFVEDLEQMLESVGQLLEDQEVWGAYDEWHRFMNRWDRILPTPLWVLVGTVIVDGPGPTVESIYHPSEGLEQTLQTNKVMDFQWDLIRQFYLLWKSVAVDVRNNLIQAKVPVPPLEEIIGTVKQIAYSMDEAVQDPSLTEHWAHLVKQEALQHYGITS